MTILSDKNLNNLFAKWADVPLRDFIDEETFASRLDLYDSLYGCKAKYEEFVKLCSEVEDVFDYGHSEYHKIVDEIVNSENYARFTTFDVEGFRAAMINCIYPFAPSDAIVKRVKMASKDVYRGDEVKRFVSIDMRSSNWTILRFFNVVDKDYFDYIEDKFSYDILKKSKYMRQVICGHLAPNRIVSVSKGIMQTLACVMLMIMDDDSSKYPFKLVCVNNDELIFEVPDDVDMEEAHDVIADLLFEHCLYASPELEKLLGSFRVKAYTMVPIKVNDKLVGYVRRFANKNKTWDTKCVDSSLMPAVIRTLKGEAVTDVDYKFMGTNNLPSYYLPFSVEVCD